MKEQIQIADPGPLGLAAFAMTTFILSLSNAHLLPASVSTLFLTLGLFYGGLAQVIAGYMEFKKNNTFGATAFSSYGFFWISLASLVYLQLTKILNFGTDASIATGTFLIAWTIFTFYMWIGTFRLNMGLLVTFTLLLATFILLDLTEFKIISGPAGGYCGILTALAAWYVSAAGIINPLYGKTVLPIGPFSSKNEKTTNLSADHLERSA